ncbi:hypothetical protein [Alistipes onderdonkii]|uniref:hypothetical protein n=1 Tax=Alistipes onderdonkii TaxID=328813 RepID=UPI0018AB573E|nr:hypothetical protein [Alistipes onderdonkii]
MEKKYFELTQLLYKLTKERKLEWRKTSSENEYMLELNAATFAISKGIEIYDSISSEFIAISMYNDKNIEIPIVSAMASDNEYPFLESLYNEAVDSCTKETETLEKVLEELNRLDLPF